MLKIIQEYKQSFEITLTITIEYFKYKSYIIIDVKIRICYVQFSVQILYFRKED